jgi:hypothetical protein
MTPLKELVVVRTMETADKTRRLTVSVVEIGIRWRCIRLTTLRRNEAGNWIRLGYVDVPPQFMDELAPALERAFDIVASGRAA